MKKIPRSVKKHIRKEKARIRKETETDKKYFWDMFSKYYKVKK
jgi:hypothetical protein